jgi:hypothetical protein
MRLVLVKEGMNGLPRADDTVMWVSANVPNASEAYVVAGDGATFVLRTSDPVAPAKNAPKEGETATEPSAWDEAEAELAGRPRTVRVRLAADRYDAAKVDALRDRILAQLGKFGHKVRGLSATDHLTVVVVGAARAAYTVTAQPAPSGTVVDATGRLLERSLALGHYGVGGSGAGSATCLTIRVTLADCQACANGSMDAAEFRRRASIAAY